MRGSAILAFALMCTLTWPAFAETPSPTPDSGPLGVDGLLPPSGPVRLQADQLLFEAHGRRISMQGNVELRYNNYIVLADRITYDETMNELLAEGGIQFQDPSGSVVRGDRFRLTDEFRDAFRRTMDAAAGGADRRNP